MRRRVSLAHRASLRAWARDHGYGAVVDLLRDVADMEQRLKAIDEILTEGFDGSYDLQAVNVAHGIAKGRALPRAVREFPAVRS